VNIGNELGLYALLALIPFVIIYLIRPRPKKMNVPSLMFFLKQSGAARVSSFLRNFVRDWLMLIQLLALLGLIFAVMSPFVFYDHDVTAQNTVIVIDASASAQVFEGGSTRFSIAQSKAKDVLGSSNTIILAKEVPLIGIQDASAQEAAEYLSEIKPRDTGSRLGDAIILAGETLSGQEGRVIVLSDFINTAGQNPETAKLVLESKSLVVDFISTAQGGKDNVGFVDLLVTEDSTIAYVKNFADSEKTVTISAGDFSKQLVLAPGTAEPVAFSTPPGITPVTLTPEDVFPLDNTLYISGPSDARTRILLITNNRSVFLENALRASPFVDVTVASPPIVPKDEYDVYVLHNLNAQDVLPGTLEDIKDRVDAGATLIVHAQEDMASFDYRGLFPFTFHGFVPPGTIIVEQTAQFTKNVDFGSVNRAFNVSGPSTSTLVSVGDAPLISTWSLGQGTAIYFGLLESESDFRLSPMFPIFWNELLKSITGKQAIESLNFRTDKTLLLNNIERVTTPTGVVREAALLLEEVGTYKYDDVTIAANLLNEAESQINPGTSSGESSTAYELRPVKERRQYDLETVLLIAAMCILGLELLYIKVRGDL
jgi:hypothetical protein